MTRTLKQPKPKTQLEYSHAHTRGGMKKEKTRTRSWITLFLSLSFHFTDVEKYRSGVACCPERSALENVPSNLYESVCMPDFDEFFHSSNTSNANNTSTTTSVTISNGSNGCLNGYTLLQPPRSQSSCSNGSTASHLTNGSTDHPPKSSGLMSGPPSAGSTTGAGGPTSYLEGECVTLSLSLIQSLLPDKDKTSVLRVEGWHFNLLLSLSFGGDCIHLAKLQLLCLTFPSLPSRDSVNCTFLSSFFCESVVNKLHICQLLLLLVLLLLL